MARQPKLRKKNDQFASGEVAWLLNGTSEGAWRHGSNNLPVLKDNLPDGVTGDIIVCVAVVVPENTTNYYYIVTGSKLNTYPNGYVFFEDEDYTNLIDYINEKTYDNDTIIYAASPVTGISLDKTELSLYVKGTEQLTATIEPDTASKVLNWTSSDETVATVNENGNVTALKAGTATITATAIEGSGVKAACTVTVKNRSGIVPQKTLTFDTNGGSEINSVTENYGKTIVLADYTPKRSGYKFLGWYKDKALSEKIEYAVLDYDMTVYAKWQKITETVEYDTLIVLTINDKTSIVNGEAVKNDVAPLIVNSRTYTPARFVAEALGAKVVWDEKTKTVTITKDDVKIILVIDSTTAYVNGTKVQMDASAFIADGRTFTPARFVAEQLGANIEWNEEARTVTIGK